MQSVEFYQEHLDRVSRSFAFCIRRLETPLRTWVSLSYLLCRALDTIEDSAWTDTGVRDAQFDEFAAFVAALPSRAAVATWSQRFPEGIPDGERALLRDAYALFEDLHGLPPQVRDDITATVLRMATGMRHYSAQHTATGEFRLADLAEVNRYCYFVAGVVGELLTRLLLEHRTDFRPGPEVLKDAFHFGLFLQKVNLLKDQREDETQGRFLVPDRAALFVSVYENARGALRYLTSLPRDEEGYRTFCAWSLFLGLASLPYIQASFDEHSGAKIPRATTGDLMTQVASIATDDAALRALGDEFLQQTPRAPAPTSFVGTDAPWFDQISGRVLALDQLRELGIRYSAADG